MTESYAPDGTRIGLADLSERKGSRPVAGSASCVIVPARVVWRASVLTG
jgi:hypothetical protein